MAARLPGWPTTGQTAYLNEPAPEPDPEDEGDENPTPDPEDEGDETTDEGENA